MAEKVNVQQSFFPVFPANTSGSASLPVSAVPFSPKIDTAVLPLLSCHKTLVDHLIDLLTQERIQSNIPLEQLEIKSHIDAETGRRLIHIRQTMATDAQTALDYWDRVSVPIEQWVAALPQPLADMVHDDIFMTIHWKPNVSSLNRFKTW